VNTVILQVSASAATPEAARDLAEVWIRGIIQQINQIEGSGGTAPPVTVIPGDSARLPTQPSSPNTKLNLALGALVGLLIGLGYAVVRDRMDRHIRSAAGVEAATGLAVVGSLPLEPALGRGSPALIVRVAPGSSGKFVALSESFRALRTNLRYMSVDDPPRAIVVTSPLPGDGKSFTAANLALTVAATGQAVVLIDGDLRRPRLAGVFGLPDGGGLSDVLADRAKVDDLLQPVDASANLRVLTSGPIPPNPSEILGSERMRHVIRELSENALVIIDSPPLFPVTDAAVLTTRADGALLVLSAGKTTYEMLEHAVDLLGKAKGKLLGVVLNRVPSKGARATNYGYRFDSDYYRTPVGPPTAPVTAAEAPQEAPAPDAMTDNPRQPTV
jgi:capsular exopolysaccharide synthesis family protein